MLFLKLKMNNDQTGSVVKMGSTFKLSKIENILNHKFSPYKIQFDTYLMAIGALIIIISQFLITGYSNSLRATIGKEFRLQVDTYRYFSVPIFGGFGASTFLDICRMSREGLLDLH